MMHRRTLYVLFMACLIMGTLTGYSFSISPSEIGDAAERSEQFKSQIKKKNIHDKEMKTEAEKTFKTYKDKVLPEVQKWKGRMTFDGSRIVINKEENSDNSKSITRNTFLQDDERIYIFISSSVPMHTLKSYAQNLDKLRDPHIVMVMRGCIGGCTKFLPTATFVQSIIAPSDEEKLVAEILIDPYLFRYYNIGKVPAIAYAKGIGTIMDEGSEGLAINLKSQPKAYLVSGDVALDYAVEKINGKMNSPTLTLIAKTLRKGWFEK